MAATSSSLETIDILLHAIYLFMRLINITMIAIMVGPSYIPLAGYMFTIMASVVAVIRPHRFLSHTVADVILLINLSILYLGLSGYRLVEDFDWQYVYIFQFTFIVPVASFQFLYAIGLLSYFLLPKKILKILQNCRLIFKKRLETDPLPYRLEHSDEYPPLLPVTDQ